MLRKMMKVGNKMKKRKSAFVTSVDYITLRLMYQSIVNNVYDTIYCWDHSFPSIYGEYIDLKSRLEQLFIHFGTSREMQETIKDRIIACPTLGSGPSIDISDSQIQDMKMHNTIDVWFSNITEGYYDALNEAVLTHMQDHGKAVLEVSCKLGAGTVNYIDFEYNNKIAEKQHQFTYYDIRETVLQFMKQECANAQLQLQTFRMSAPFDETFGLGCAMSSFYKQIQEFYELIFVREKKYFDYHSVKIIADSQLKLRATSVNTVVDEIIALLKQDQTETNHSLTSTQGSITLDQFVDAVKLLAPEMQLSLAEADLNLIDRMFCSKIARYIPYFILDHNECPSAENTSGDLSAADFMEFTQGYVNTSNTRRQIVEQNADNAILSLYQKSIVCRFGLPLDYYCIGEGPALMIIGALASNCVTWKWLLSNLSKQFRIFIWQPRGLEDDLSHKMPEGELFDFRQRALDIQEIMDYEKIDSSYFIGFCSGVCDLLTFHESNHPRVKGMMLINSQYSVVHAPIDVDSNNDHYDMVQAISKGPNLANVMIRMMKKTPHIKVDVPSIPDKQLEKMINFMDPDYADDLQSGLLNPAGIIHYSKIYYKDMDFDFLKLVEPITCPLIILSASNDSMAGCSQAQWLHAKMEGSKYYEIPAANHYTPMHNWEVISRLVRLYFCSH